jgi:hypothetical protein
MNVEEMDEHILLFVVVVVRFSLLLSSEINVSFFNSGWQNCNHCPVHFSSLP